MNNKIIKIVGILLLVVLVLAAFNTLKPKEKINGKTWTLISMSSLENQTISDSQITLEFHLEDNQISGSAGCNNYFAGFEINGDELSISAPGSTMMYCEPELLMAQEFAFLAALGEAHHYSVQNGQLIMEFGDGKILIFE